jgi:cytochrome c-type biogenesis protein CcmE
MTEKLMMYAVGREIEYYDMPQVREIVRTAKRQDYRFSALVLGVVQSDAFRMQAVRREAESLNEGSAQAALVR